MSERCEGCGDSEDVGLMDLGKGMHAHLCGTCEAKALGLSNSVLELLAAQGDPLKPIQAALYDVLAAVDTIDAGEPRGDLASMVERIRETDTKVLAHTAAFAVIELRRRHEYLARAGRGAGQSAT